MEWMNRTGRDGKKGRAGWAAVGLAICSLGVQVTNFVRTDLKPLLELSRQTAEAVKRIETRLEDHERRIGELERRGK